MKSMATKKKADPTKKQQPKKKAAPKKEKGQKSSPQPDAEILESGILSPQAWQRGASVKCSPNESE